MSFYHNNSVIETTLFTAKNKHYYFFLRLKLIEMYTQLRLIFQNFNILKFQYFDIFKFKYFDDLIFQSMRTMTSLEIESESLREELRQAKEQSDESDRQVDKSVT